MIPVVQQGASQITFNVVEKDLGFRALKGQHFSFFEDWNVFVNPANEINAVWEMGQTYLFSTSYVRWPMATCFSQHRNSFMLFDSLKICPWEGKNIPVCFNEIETPGVVFSSHHTIWIWKSLSKYISIWHRYGSNNISTRYVMLMTLHSRHLV